MDQKVLEFSIFCIESLSEKLKIDGKSIYKILNEDTNILEQYIIPCYESLHTQSKEYIVNDLIEVLTQKGIKVV